MTGHEAACAVPEGPAPLPSWGRHCVLVLQNELRIELKSGEVVITAGFFAVLVVVLTSMAFYVGPANRAEVAAGAIWLSVAFAAVLALGRTWQREREEGALDGLLTAPVAPSAIYAGKALALNFFLLAIEGVVLPLCSLLFGVDIGECGPMLLLITLVATPGIAASGTLFGGLTVRTRARDLVLAVVLFPLLAPTLLTAVVTTRELLGGAEAGELVPYFKLMGIFDICFIAGGIGMFGTLTEN